MSISAPHDPPGHPTDRPTLVTEAELLDNLGTFIYLTSLFLHCHISFCLVPRPFQGTQHLQDLLDNISAVSCFPQQKSFCGNLLLIYDTQLNTGTIVCQTSWPASTTRRRTAKVAKSTYSIHSQPATHPKTIFRPHELPDQANPSRVEV